MGMSYARHKVTFTLKSSAQKHLTFLGFNQAMSGALSYCMLTPIMIAAVVILQTWFNYRPKHHDGHTFQQLEAVFAWSYSDLFPTSSLLPVICDMTSES